MPSRFSRFPLVGQGRAGQGWRGLSTTHPEQVGGLSLEFRVFQDFGLVDKS